MSADAPNVSVATRTDVTPSKAAGRDHYFSNAKLALIVSVVIGHAWAPLIGGSSTVWAFYMTLYNFHMPAFILICGYFCRSFTGRPDQLRRLITGILAPYLVFSLMYAVMRLWTEGAWSWNPLYPWYLTWFLVALFVWRVTSPIWRIIRHPVVVATLIAIGAMFLDLPQVLDVGRILQFLPFFVLGMHLRREHFERLKRPFVQWGGLLLSAVILAAAFAVHGHLDRSWVYYNRGADELDVSLAAALPIRVILLSTSAVLIVTFFALVPDRRLPVTALGEQTMYAFILHGFFIKIAEDGLGLYDTETAQSAAGAVGVTLLAALLAVALMSPPIRWLLRPLVEPRLNWLLRAPEQRRRPMPYPTS